MTLANMPALMRPSHLMAALGFSKSEFYRRQGAGHFRMFEVARPIGTARYSRERVERYLEGAPVAAFGAAARRSPRRPQPPAPLTSDTAASIRAHLSLVPTLATDVATLDDAADQRRAVAGE